MRRERQKRTIKLRLLALALALLLTWYALNPAPGPAPRRRGPAEEKPPEGESRAANSYAVSPFSLAAHAPPLPAELGASPAEDDEPENMDWPEYIFCD